jgi:hypothetical protein
VSHTFRRDHFRVRVDLDDGTRLEVAVTEDAPPTGTTLRLAVAASVPLQG